jgi:hypothetical protein
MTGEPAVDPETMLRVQRFAELALDEISRRGGDDGFDPIQLHIAYCVASLGFLANTLGPARTLALLDRLGAIMRAADPERIEGLSHADHL